MEFVLFINYNEYDLICVCVCKEWWVQQVLYEEFYSLLMVICLCYMQYDDEVMDLLYESFIKIFCSIYKYKFGILLGVWM